MKLSFYSGLAAFAIVAAVQVQSVQIKQGLQHGAQTDNEYETLLVQLSADTDAYKHHHDHHHDKHEHDSKEPGLSKSDAKAIKKLEAEFEQAKVEAANARVEKPIKEKKDDGSLGTMLSNPFDGAFKSSLTLGEKLTEAQSQVKHYRAELVKKKEKGNEKAANTAAGKLATARKELEQLQHKMDAKKSVKTDAADKKLSIAAKKLEDAKNGAISKALKTQDAVTIKKMTDSKVSAITKSSPTKSVQDSIAKVIPSVSSDKDIPAEVAALDLAINKIKHERELKQHHDEHHHDVHHHYEHHHEEHHHDQHHHQDANERELISKVLALKNAHNHHTDHHGSLVYELTDQLYGHGHDHHNLGISEHAYSRLKPAVKALTKFAGPKNAEKLFGMTPVGRMLGVGCNCDKPVEECESCNKKKESHSDSKHEEEKPAPAPPVPATAPVAAANPAEAPKQHKEHHSHEKEQAPAPAEGGMSFGNMLKMGGQMMSTISSLSAGKKEGEAEAPSAAGGLMGKAMSMLKPPAAAGGSGPTATGQTGAGAGSAGKMMQAMQSAKEIASAQNPMEAAMKGASALAAFMK